MATVAFWQTISWLCGWVYFTSWSLSFYPQGIENMRRRTTKGLLPDFILLNILGFTSLVISNAVFLYSPVVRHQYAARHPAAPEPTVRINDLVFGVHGLALCFFWYTQFWPKLWGWTPIPGYRPRTSAFSLGLFFGSILGIVLVILYVGAYGVGDDVVPGAPGWIDVIYAMGYVKLLLTFFKYFPQVISNIQRHSTLGWSANQTMCDIVGGVLSLIQLVIDSRLQGDWSGITGNPLKFGLSIVSIVFDAIFLIQHFVLYGPVDRDLFLEAADDTPNPPNEVQPLLQESSQGSVP